MNIPFMNEELKPFLLWLDNGKLSGKEDEKFQRINCATLSPILETTLENICLEFDGRL